MALHNMFRDDMEDLQQAWRQQAEAMGVEPNDRTGGWGSDEHFKYVKVVKEATRLRLVRTHSLGCRMNNMVSSLPASVCPVCCLSGTSGSHVRCCRRHRCLQVRARRLDKVRLHFPGVAPRVIEAHDDWYDAWRSHMSKRKDRVKVRPWLHSPWPRGIAMGHHSIDGAE